MSERPANTDPPHVAVCGAGLGGALVATFLARRGLRVDLYERRPDPRQHGFAGGRSINLALSVRGLSALERLGLAETVLADAIPMRGRMMHARDGELTFQPYSKDSDEAINSVSRGVLNMTLLDAAEDAGATVHFGWRCVDADLDAPAVMLQHIENDAELRAEADVVVGADGAFSAVRSRMQRTEGFDYSQHYLEHGYKELTIPPTASGGFAIEANALHIWPRGGFMMIALPNKDCTFTCTCFWPMSGPHGFDRLVTDDDVLACFREHFGDAVPLIPKLVEDYDRNPVGRLVTVRCAPWHHRDRVVLVGDAAHAIVPFYGQGMNCAFEDCAVLDEMIETHGTDWARVFESYSAARKSNGDAIADMALVNFIEMRDSVGSTTFLLWKKIEHALHRWFPQWYTPLYHMVTFSNIPYADAKRRAVRQLAIVRGVAAGVGLLLLILLATIIF